MAADAPASSSGKPPGTRQEGTAGRDGTGPAGRQATAPEPAPGLRGRRGPTRLPTNAGTTGATDVDQPEHRPVRDVEQPPGPRVYRATRRTTDAPELHEPARQPAARGPPLDPFSAAPPPPAPFPAPMPAASNTTPAAGAPASGWLGRGLQRWWPFMLLAVLVSSLLGLARYMSLRGGGFLGQVWGASLWADLLFVAGTLTAVWLSAHVASGLGRPSPARFAAAVGLSLACHMAVYAVSWGLASGNFEADAPFVAFRFVAPQFAEALASLPGLAVVTFYGPLMGLFLPPKGAPASSPG